MTDQHRATPEQWATQKAWAVSSYDSSCILELRDRLEALEAHYETQRLATLAWGKDLDNHGRWMDDHLKRIMALEAARRPDTGTTPAPADSLVERVKQQTIEGNYRGETQEQVASTVILEVASWLAENADQAREDLTNEEAAQWLRDEVARLGK